MGIFKREKEYDKKVEIAKLSEKLEKYLKDDKWEVQVVNLTDEPTVFQARKVGILREIFASDRALTIILSKTDNGTKVQMGVGKWIQNIAVTIVESVLLTSLFLVIDVPEMLWNVEIENKIQKKIDEFINEM